MTTRETEGTRTTQGAEERRVSRRTVLLSSALAAGALVPAVSSGEASPGKKNQGTRRDRERVVDRADPYPDPAIVLGTLDVPIGDWTVYAGESVADQNRDYDPDEPVVVVAFEHLLDAGWSDWRRASHEELLDGVTERGIKFHAFPESRLEKPSMRSGGTGGFQPGTPVVDRADPDPDTAIVLTEPGVPIGDWTVYAGETVADQNRDYDPDEPVVVVALEHLLDEEWPTWKRGPKEGLFDDVVERGIKFHAFPRSRLEARRPKGS